MIVTEETIISDLRINHNKIMMDLGLVVDY